MSKQSLNVIIFGATGLAGSGVLEECLKHPAVGRVAIITRKLTRIKHQKIIEILHRDFLNYSSIKEKLVGYDSCFWCLGVSQAQVRDKALYREITLDYTLTAATVLIEMNPGMTFCFLSGMGTDSTMKSRLMWARVKGEAEKTLNDLSFGKLFLFRPGYIHPVGKTKHRMRIARILSPLYPILNKLFPDYVTTTSEFGRAMINAALNFSEKQVLENRDIRELAFKN